MRFSTHLDAEQTERLALLIEECGEVIQAASKILRHGYDSCHPTRSSNNREDLEQELGHVAYAVSLLARGGDVNPATVEHWKAKKAEKIIHYLHHNKKIASIPDMCELVRMTTTG